MHQGLTQRMSADASRLGLTRRIRCRLVVGPVADTRIDLFFNFNPVFDFKDGFFIAGVITLCP